ncbi:ANL_collapsed_G0042040.mRNA.1.CDS.1 [Saccharomyces cerevisiae]|nr:ANL_collapsed_G0042040.mRNA.1.CDS.1 [Saccharomyces cerevisiae]
MKQENFAPVLPIIEYEDLDETINKIIEEHDTPLVQYIFSDSQTEINRILTRLRSGDCVVGDTVIHVGITDAPFGGIGTSGYGNYGGYYGFNTFSHERTIFKQPYWNDFTLFYEIPSK